MWAGMAGIHIDTKRFKVIVKPNAKKTGILGFDENKKALRVAVSAPPDKNKANVELVRFLSKNFRPVRIVSGLSSREKLLEFRD